jgi:diguanylate cyclase (GGDEF)-like protein/PAS domain S-box-containing protein
MNNEINNMSGLAKIREDLNVSELRCRWFFESARDGMLILDAASGKIIEANPFISQLSGYPRDEIPGRELWEIGLFKDKRENDAALCELSEKGSVRHENLLLETKAGQTLEVEFAASVYAEEGDRRVIQCRISDISERRRAEKEREEATQNTLLAHIAGKAARLGGWTIHLPEKTLIWSDENCAIHDVPPGYKPTLEEGIGYFPPEYREQVIRYVENCAKDGTSYDFELPKYTAKGRLIWVRSIGEAVRDADGKIIRLQGAFQDITVRRQAEQELRASQEQYKQMVEHASDIIYKTDVAGRFTFINPTIHKILKYTEEEFLNLHYLDVVRPDFRQALRRAYGRQLSRRTPNTYYEFIALTKDGAEVWLGQHAQLLCKGDQITGFQAICRDITNKKQTEEELRNLSLTDELTGLYNRRGFLALGEHQLKLAQSKRIEKKLLVIYIDLDGLKQINDTFGHDEGSRAIVKTAELLKQTFRHSDLIARLGGDEFVVLAIEANEENTEMIVSRLQENFKNHNARKTHAYDLSFSFGVARFDSKGDLKIEDLIKTADMEMYHQKRSKKSHKTG